MVLNYSVSAVIRHLMTLLVRPLGRGRVALLNFSTHGSKNHDETRASRIYTIALTRGDLCAVEKVTTEDTVFAETKTKTNSLPLITI